MNKQLFSKIFKFSFYIKKILKIPFFLNEILKIKILQYIPNNINSKNKSASEFSYYPEFCLKAALDFREFKTFRRHPKYTGVVETVSKNLAQEYLDIIKKKYCLKNNEILEIIEPLQNLGMPKKFFLKGFDTPLSALALRYLMVGLNINEKIKNYDGIDIVEIGCGFGGQALILNKLLKIKSYTFIDIWQVNILIKRFLHDSFFDKPYSLLTLNDLKSENKNWDLLISNYAFSELPLKIQKIYFENVISKSKEGYMLMNSGEKGEFGRVKNFSKQELKSKIDNSYLDNLVGTKNNYLIRW